MNKTTLVEAIVKQMSCTKKDAERFLETFIDIITTQLQKGNEITITGFGSFQVSKRAARQGVNPKTGEKIKIAATTVPKFKSGKTLKDAVKK
jgi:DNA-binding protein HU-beta